MSIKEISIDQLRTGMYVCEIALPWIKNPFFRQKLLIRKESEIEQLRQAGCKTVKIDTSKGADADETASAVSSPEPEVEADTSDCAHEPTPPARNAQEQNPNPASGPVPSLEALTQRQAAALKIRHQTLAAIQEINQQVAKGHVIEQEAILPLVDNLIDQLNENEQAILASLNIKASQSALNAHLYNSMTLALSAGSRFIQDKEQLMLLGQAALLHDIGWVKLPAYLLQKGRAFTPQEERLEKQHVELALTQLRGFPGLPPVVRSLIATHHEQPNGKGYPKGLKDADLSEAAKLLAVVVRYDEIIHGLYGNLGMLPARAMKQLFKEAQQGKLDTRLVAAFIHFMGVYPLGSAVELSDGTRGVVICHHPDTPLHPQILVHYSATGEPLNPPQLLDLNQHSVDVSITQIIDPDDPKADPHQRLRPDEGNHA